MADLLADALAWHREQLETHASQTVVYRRGEFQAEIAVTYGSRNSAAEYAANTLRVETQQRDFLIAASSLVIDGEQTTPRGGLDQIEVTENGVTRIYRVLALADGPAWDWDNDYRQLMVVHTKAVGESTEV